jgi:hypothetical protein
MVHLIRLCGAAVACRVRSGQAMAAACCVAVVRLTAKRGGALRSNAHCRPDMAWQPGRGARHNASFREPEGRKRSAAVDARSELASVCGNFAECGVMLNGTFTPPRLCRCVAFSG